MHAVVFFHAATVCAAECVWAGAYDRRLCHRSSGPTEGWAFSALHDLAHTNTVLVVPQLHSGRDSALGRSGGFTTMLDAVARHVSAHLDPAAPPLRFAGTVLAAHSLGGRTLQRVLAFPDVAHDVRAVLLYDSLADRPEVLLSWWQAPSPGAPRRLLTLHAGVRAAATLAQGLVAATRHRPPGTLVTRIGDLTRDLREHPMVAAPSRMPHEPIAAFYFTKSLAALGLPTRNVSEPWESAPPRSPVPIAMGATVHDRLLPPDSGEGEARRYRDYALTLPVAACADITLTGGEAQWSPRGHLDTRLQVFVGGARVLDDDDGVGASAPGSERFDSRVRWCATEAATTAVLRASSRLGSWSGGAFTLDVRPVPSP